MPVGGVVYILEQITGSQERHICSIHTLTPILSSIPSSTKRPFYAIFTPSHHTKNHIILPKNPLKPL